MTALGLAFTVQARPVAGPQWAPHRITHLEFKGAQSTRSPNHRISQDAG
jgi:hypothetical protein